MSDQLITALSTVTRQRPSQPGRRPPPPPPQLRRAADHSSRTLRAAPAGHRPAHPSDHIPRRYRALSASLRPQADAYRRIQHRRHNTTQTVCSRPSAAGRPLTEMARWRADPSLRVSPPPPPVLLDRSQPDVLPQLLGRLDVDVCHQLRVAPLADGRHQLRETRL